MNETIRSGVWPTMLTPYTAGGEVDYDALGRLIEWYLDRGVDGLFAVCQSSEMFYLSLEERVKVAEYTVRRAAGRVPVIASGHIADGFEEQVEELNAMAATGIDALVLITNRLAGPEESDETLKSRLERLLERLPQELPLGFYECPYPYKRLVTPELLRWCAETGRFAFLKDTCCDLEMLRSRMEAVRDSGLKIYNANTTTLLESLKFGISGYSGVMANFHPELYVWLLRHWKDRPEEAQRLIPILTAASWVEKQLYPINAKYYLTLEGVLENFVGRSKDAGELNATYRLEVEQMRELSLRLAAELSS
ncbi:dihydrodipicolinate synthase family protein [Cohnella sp. CIP 111063]|uniref:dihydrodipicolinate synthase family protein n=1 Tax=unclassified Cohnella TaxID=2636738 RepID=UPI000B8C0F46|nr:MULTISPECIES: dihydrodipicolinate synthase family protein [unclassified Cohnella]OXS54733.1 dihydrodipicolinate synthase family protein [Cohnella sp. CIP 111063]PRX64570.1 4-hydroxy-tetrahydrodipicolinate synthase [Cohnella sp. SGD-V74]